MRVSRLAVVVAAAAIVLPAGLASMAMADDAPAGGGTVSSTPNADDPPPPPPGGPGPGARGLSDEQRKCMEDKGFGRPDFKRGERPERPSREEMEKRREGAMAAAKECGLPERQKWHRGPGGPGGPDGPRMHKRRFELNDEQRKCMEEKGFGRPNGERRQERPSREEMEKKRAGFEAAAKECGLPTPPERRGPRAHPQPVPPPNA